MPDRKPRKPGSRPAQSRPAPETDALARASTLLAKGQPALALPLLLPELDARAASGDAACALAAAALRLAQAQPSPIAPDALSATVSRLVTLVRRQDEQIRALRALIEEEL